jgi:hypothetical protein
MKVGDVIRVPLYRRNGTSWRMRGLAEGRVVYVHDRYIVVDWGLYREALWPDDLAKRVHRWG